MKAVVFHDIGDIRLEDVKEPKIKEPTDAIVALTDCDRDAVIAFIRRLYLDGVKDPKRLTFKGLQALARG